MNEKLRITILGAGFAGLETAFLLRMRLRDRVDLTLVSEREAFTFRPNTIYVPFGAEPDDLVVDMAKPFHRRHVTFIQGTAAGVDPDAHVVRLADGTDPSRRGTVGSSTATASGAAARAGGRPAARVASVPGGAAACRTGPPARRNEHGDSAAASGRRRIHDQDRKSRHRLVVP